MSRYPSEDVARFDQQFAETAHERNERRENRQRHPKLFKTTVSGIGPFCIEFDDGEIITTRTEQRQLLIAAAPEMCEALKAAREELRLINMKDTSAVYHVGLRVQMDIAIAKAEGAQ